MNRESDLVIIGAGPAGMVAALYASRAGLSVNMIDASAPGGKLLKTYQVDNYPGVPEVSGPDLAIAMFGQATAFGATFETNTVEKITADKQVFLANGDVISAKAILIATGNKEKQLNIPGEQEAIGHGESFCATCDGAFFRNQRVMVIGGGNSALEEAEFLTRFASKVFIVIRRDVFRAEARIQRAVEENDKIEVVRHAVPVEVKMTDGSVSSVVLKDVETGEPMELEVEGLFPFIGATPETAFAKDLGILDEQGYVKVNGLMETSVPGIYGAGDCTNTELRQIVTATGDGALAATSAFHYITNLTDI